MLTSQAGPSRDVSAGGGHGDDEVCAWMLTYVCVLADYHSQIDRAWGKHTDFSHLQLCFLMYLNPAASLEAAIH